MAQVSTSAAHERPGASPILFGTILFLASELLFFGGLFGAYFALRAETSPWPPEGVELETMLAAIATALLVLSSGTFHLGWWRRDATAPAGCASGSRSRSCSGSAFLGIQLYDYSALSFEVSSSAYGTMYYAMTGPARAARGRRPGAARARARSRGSQGTYRAGRIDGMHAVGYYWHFVDIVWVGLFATLFLVR